MKENKGKIATENQEQRALIKWIRLQPKIIDVIIKINNEGKRTSGQHWNAILMGLHAGACDLFLAFPTPRYHGLWLEVKRNKQYTKSEQSTETWKAQEAFIEMIENYGYKACFVFGWEHGKQFIEDYMYYDF